MRNWMQSTKMDKWMYAFRKCVHSDTFWNRQNCSFNNNLIKHTYIIYEFLLDVFTKATENNLFIPNLLGLNVSNEIK